MKNPKILLKISDIARLAGVSTATVSRVLNDKEMVSKDVRQRVLKIVEEQDYHPQRVHKKPATRPAVAILSDVSINPFFAQILTSLWDGLADQGLVGFIVQLPAGNGSEVEILKKFRQIPWCGIISAGFYMNPDKWIRLHEETQTPMVLLNTLVDHPGISSIRVNFEGAMLGAVQHLLDLGHTHIAYLGDLENDFSLSELKGVEKALNHFGLSYPEEYRFSVSHTPEGASQGIYHFTRLPPHSQPTAILAFDDEFAIHVLNALNYYGSRVPDDVSVIGFDNIPMSAHTQPPLTTIDVPKYRIGLQMASLLQQHLKNDRNKPVGNIIVESSLIVRGSTGPKPKD